MIEIVDTAPLNSVQDLGRTGSRSLGIARGGAMDRVALAVANALLGNDESAACIEFQLYPVTIRFLAATAFALTGADTSPKVDDKEVLPWWTMSVVEGQQLVLSAPKRGLRAYLAMPGGIDVPVILGSRSTQLRENFGGHEGRALQNGDKLRSMSPTPVATRDRGGFGAVPPEFRLHAASCRDKDPLDIVLRVLPASEYDLLDERSKQALWSTPWQVSSRSNRMGYQLSGAALSNATRTEMRSHAIVPGVIQLPPSGQPIIQLADGNSAGGYPKVGVVIEPDLWRIAQAAPGQRLRFVRTSYEEALAAESETIAYLSDVRQTAAFCRRQS